jgi:hypothetical protein
MEQIDLSEHLIIGDIADYTAQTETNKLHSLDELNLLPKPLLISLCRLGKNILN